MGKSGETFSKKEKEKKRAKKRQEKMEKMEERKANAKSKTLDDMMAYIDENGNLSTTPPDPSRKKVFKAEDMQIGVPKYEAAEEDATRSGVVTFFNEAKGFGFIKDAQSGDSVFVHVNQLADRVAEGDKVSFETERGPRGLNAVGVKKI